MKVSTIRRVCFASLLAFLLCGVSGPYAAENDRAPYWPSFHGPNRDNISPETGFLKQWPEGGPKLIWKYSECGDGYSTVTLADGMIFTAGDFGDEEMVIALSLEGQLLWKSPNGPSWKGSHPGSRATPTYDDGALYHLGPTGRIAAYKAKSGKEIWSVDLQSKFGARYGTWALAENVIVDGTRVLCVPGGSKGLVVALSKRTGRPVWANTELDEKAAYCSPLIVKYKGVRQLITLTQKSVICVEVRSGRLLWSHPQVTPNDQNVTTPIFRDGYVFVTSAHQAGGRLLKIARNLRAVAEVWSSKELDNCHGGVILLGDRLYGSGCQAGGKALFCADFLTGKVIHSDKSIRKLSLTCAEGMLYGVDQRGQMYLLAPTPEGFDVVSQFDVPREGMGPLFAHPVVCGGRLYIRHGNNLYVYDIRAE